MVIVVVRDEHDVDRRQCVEIDAAITNRRGPANETGDARLLHMGSVRTLIAPSWSSTVA